MKEYAESLISYQVLKWETSVRSFSGKWWYDRCKLFEGLLSSEDD